MTAQGVLTTAILLPAAMGGAQLLLPRQPRGMLTTLVLSALAAPIASLALLLVYLARHGLDGRPDGWTWMPQFQLDWLLLPDGLGLFFALLVAGVGVLIALYTRGYFGPDRNSLFRFYPTLLLFMTAMLGLVLADNFMLLVLFWELTSISSFLLIGWERDDDDAVKKALQAFIVTGVGGLALLGGLVLLGVQTGAWSFSALVERGVQHDPLTTAAFVLIFAGAAAKSAQWPLHFWLPGAMAAPTPVSAYLHSATMVKAGVYLVARLWPTMAAALPSWPVLLISFGAVTMVVAAYVALRKQDLKQIFAYTTVAQLGLLMSAYGLGAYQNDAHPTLLWEITQILNHALYKAPLFLLAGGIAHVTGTRLLSDLGGLARRGGLLGFMGILLLLAAYAMAAGPFTLSFSAKEFFLYGIYHWYQSSGNPAALGLGAAAVFNAIFTVAIFVRMMRVLLAGPRQSRREHERADPRADLLDHEHDHPHHHETGFWPAMLWAPAALLIGLQYLGGVAPAAFDALFGTIEISRVYFATLPSTLYLLSHPGVPLYLSAAALGIGILLGLAPLLRRAIEDVHDRLFPAFYLLSTKGGGRLFRVVQTGNLRAYLLLIFIALVALPWWAVYQSAPAGGRWWPEVPPMEHWRSLLPGYLIALLVCLSAVLMPVVKDRASRIIVLGTVGFSVTAVYYLDGAPDLALTQISIEIVSLILFLLVLSQLPATAPHAPARHPARQAVRLAVSLALGFTMFFLALNSSATQRPIMSHLTHQGRPFENLGEFFLRNSYEAIDVPAREGGGGGNNVVNVILVDFRGLDTLGEITVLGLAAMGVWTLLRRRIPQRGAHSLQRNLSEPPRPSDPQALPAQLRPAQHLELAQRSARP